MRQASFNDRRTRGKRRLVVVLGVLALCVVGTGGFLYWHEAVEIWHVSRFESAGAGAHSRGAIAELLVARRSLRAVPTFLKFESQPFGSAFEPHAGRILAGLAAREHANLAALLRTEDDALPFRIVRLAASSGVAPARLLPYLRRALRSGEAGFRRWACQELGAIGPPAAPLATELQAATGDGDRFVRLWARIALARIAPDSPAVVDLLRVEASR